MASDKAHSSKTSDDGEVKKAWEPMTLTYVGKATDVVQGGGGKVSVSTADTGDVNKPKGQG